MKQILALIKPYFRWFLWGVILFFLVKTVKDRFAEVSEVRIDGHGWQLLGAALAITIVAHIWSAWVWTRIVKIFRQPLEAKEGIRVYIVTNIAKYSPGNIWHFYGRISAIARKGGSRGAATLCVLLEPLLMAAAALLIGLVSEGINWQENLNTQSNTQPDTWLIWLQVVSLVIVLLGINPLVLNGLLHRLSFKKNKVDAQAAQAFKLEKYPLLPFLGEIVFVIFRGTGFMLTFMALQPLSSQQIPSLVSAFSFAWLLGLVVPGAPGGIGVFEVTAYGLLDNSQFPTEIAAVGLFRLVSILAEAIAATVSWKIGKSG